MKNRVFMSKSAEEKRRRLTAILKKGTGGKYDGATIRRIVNSVSIHRQYNVSVFSDSRMFQSAVARAKTGKTPLFIVYSPKGGVPFAAVITPAQPYGCQKGARAIYVCMPGRQTEKGRRTWARASKNGRRSRSR